MKKEYVIKLSDREGNIGVHQLKLPYYMPVSVISDILQHEYRVTGCGSINALANHLNQKYGWILNRKLEFDDGNWDWYQELTA